MEEGEIDLDKLSWIRLKQSRIEYEYTVDRIQKLFQGFHGISEKNHGLGSKDRSAGKMPATEVEFESELSFFADI